MTECKWISRIKLCEYNWWIYEFCWFINLNAGMKNITMCLRVKWGFKLAVKVLPFNFVILRSLHLNYQNPNSKQIFLMYSIVSEVVDQLFVFLELAFIWRLYFLVGWELKLSIMAYWSRWEPPSVQANLLYDFITSSITNPCNIHVCICVM